ncbi:hypothetical protein HPB47_006253 [Ixodes persulcatus]|uniref:Uncharacterized protein n=1 Tax=Ixodes persulcatus TaxID=34615 RepID=A0AC60PBR5_IXOPE|nr:hypothetical protein HPB47_006253 [Ixodes persulcatus]
MALLFCKPLYYDHIQNLLGGDIKAGVLSELAGLGAYPMGHVWLLKLKTPEAKEKLLQAGEIQVKGRRCLAIDPYRRESWWWFPGVRPSAYVADALGTYGASRAPWCSECRGFGHESTDCTRTYARAVAVHKDGGGVNEELMDEVEAEEDASVAGRANSEGAHGSNIQAPTEAPNTKDEEQQGKSEAEQTSSTTQSSEDRTVPGSDTTKTSEGEKHGNDMDFFNPVMIKRRHEGADAAVAGPGTYSDAVRRGPAPRTESRATQFSLEDLAGPSQAPKQPAGKQGAPANAESTQLPQSIQARPPADRQPRASGSSQDGERGRRSNSSEAARLVTEQQGPPAAPSTSKDGSMNAGGSRPGTSKPSSAGSGRGRKLVAQVSDHVGTGKPASKVRDAVGAVDIADSSGPSSDQEDMEWQTAKSKQKGKRPVVPP